MSAFVRWHSRRGYTLIELLLTLSLTSALLLLISAAIGLFEHYASAGRARAERSQIARALLDNLEMDLRRVVYRDPPAAEDEANAVAPLGALDAPPAFEKNRLNDKYGDASLGIIGDEQQLFLHVADTPRSEFRETQTAIGEAGTRYVIWAVTTVPATENSGQFVDRSSPVIHSPQRADRNQTGVARLTIERLDSGLNRGQDFSLAAMLAGKKRGSILASEVRAIRYRYRDHDGWRNSWNSAAAQRLPRAIEVTLEFEPQHQMPEGRDILRVVIPVNLSEPYMPPTGIPQSSGGR